MKYFTKISLLCFLILLHNVSFGSVGISLQPMNSSCGNNNGSVQTTVYAGSGPFSFIWSSGQTTQNISNLSPGTYTVTVTDALGSSTSSSATIIDTPTLEGITVSYVIPPNGLGITHPCNNLCNGIAYIYTSNINGIPPYSIGTSMSHNIGFSALGNCPTIEGICSNDNYTILVSDAMGCAGIGMGTMSYPPNDFSYNELVAPACNGINNGVIQLDFNNSQSIAYSVNWSGPSSGNISSFQYSCTIPSLLPGTYNINISNTLAVGVCDTNITVIVPDLGFNCGTVSGQVYFDSTANCTKDVNEPTIPSRLIRFTPGPYYAASDNSGNYTASLPYGTYTAETFDDFHFTNICPANGVSISVGTPNISGVDIGDSTSSDLDLSVYLSSGAARPGFNYQVYASITNSSVINAINPEVVINYDPVLTFISSTIPYTVTGPAQITLQFPTINMFSSNYSFLTFSIPPNPLLLGNILTTTATLNANQAEPDLSNNTDILQQMITGSYDPNDKKVWPAMDINHTFLIDVDTMFRYTIRFQNSGTDTAFNITLVDTLNPYLDITTFQKTGSSHNCRWEITGPNILKVYYENILLPDSNVNEPGSHGLFSFSIRPTQALHTILFPYILENTAAIYFDFNPPIITNTEYSTIDISVGLSEIEGSQIYVYPNPASQVVTIGSKDKLPLLEISLTDLQGRLLKQTSPETASYQIDIAQLSAGIYFIEATTSTGVSRTKLVKK